MYQLGDEGGDGVGRNRSITGGDDDGVRVRVKGGSPNGSENGSGLDLPLFQYGFPVGFFVPVPCVPAHVDLVMAE